MNHTPGPWDTGIVHGLHFFAEPYYAISGDEDSQKRMSGNSREVKGLVCSISPLSKLSDEDRANAKLIAAAPDLLAALIAVVEDRFFDEMTNTTCTLVTEAINKATK